jgi:DNA replication ATP-dependent helicase Dna2
MSVDEKTASVQGSVTRISSEPKTATKGGYLFRGLELSGETDAERIFIILPEFSGEDLYAFPLLCWEGCQVAAYGLQLNNRLDNGSVIYTATPESDLILEPHRPVSVTDAVEAAACIRSVDVRYRVGTDEPFWMAKGRLIHTLFDRLLSDMDAPGDHAFHEGFKKALPALKAVLPGSRIPTDLKSLEKDARVHFDNLREWLDNTRNLFSSAEIELDRISSRWGLKGRSDAILHHKHRRTIVELKSGKVPVLEHLLQLYAYALIFREEGSDAAINGCVLYSATGKTETLGSPRSDWRKLVIKGRNGVVALKHSFLTQNPEPLEHGCGRKGKCFSRAGCLQLFGNASTGKGALLNGAERDYYATWYTLLSRDAWAQESEFSRVLDPRTQQERIDEGLTLTVNEARLPENPGIPNCDSADEREADPMDKPSENRKGWRLRAGRSETKDRLVVELLFNEIVADVSPAEEVMVHRGDPCGNDSFRGTVIASENGRIVVGIKVPFSRSCNDAEFRARSAFSTAGDWFLDRLPFSRGRDVARHALFKFLVQGDPAVKRAVVHAGPRPAGKGSTDESLSHDAAAPEGVSPQPSGSAAVSAPGDDVQDLCFSEGLTSELNEDQEAAVTAALDSETFHLIHGPPGTGKTRVLARLLRVCLDRGERVLVACPTNVALDRLLMSLMQLGVHDFLRVGGRGTVSEEFLDALKEAGNPTCLLDDLCSQPMEFAAFKKRVADTRLVGATAYQASAHPVLLGQKFHRVVVDEAGQLDEPSTLGPLAMAPRFVLGGDHLQLPPVVKERAGNTLQGESSGLERSLFERLFHAAPEERISRLKIQYRMNREVQDIPSRLFYGGTLVPFPDVARRRLNLNPGVAEKREINRIIDPELPVVFVDVHSPDSGKASPEEAAIACRIVESLIASGVAAYEIGIITPYRAQQALIRRFLTERTGGRVFLSVDTVDRFQGGEKEVIILSLARSDGVTSFLADRKRLNVSLSRARSKLILLGHGPALEEHPLFCSILQGLERIRMGSA